MTSQLESNEDVLILNGNEIRTLPDLRKHFQILLVYELFQDGTLERWLKKQGYEAEYEKIMQFPKDGLNGYNVGDFYKIFVPDCTREEIADLTQHIRILEIGGMMHLWKRKT